MLIYHIFTQHACVFAHYKSIESRYSYNARSLKPSILTSSVSPLAAELHFRCDLHCQPLCNVVNISED